MKRLQIARIKSVLTTPEGLFGFDLRFKSGLNLIRAENTCGKSTCAISLIYALGLEGMFQYHQGVPMTDVMTRAIDYESRLIPVTESYVQVELESSDGRKATIRRGIKSNKHLNLITVWSEHSADDEHFATAPSDYFVRIEGAAFRERGFHTWLKDFLGWKLPSVPNLTGGEVDLHLESLVSLFFIEQKKGWSGIQANTPAYQVKDVGRRAFEYIMALTTPSDQWKREKIRQEVLSIKEQWKTALNACDIIAEEINGIQMGIPETPTASWPPKVQPFISVRENDTVMNAGKLLEICQVRLKEISSREIPSIKEISQQIEREISEKTNMILQLESKRVALLSDLSVERAYEESISERVDSLREDLQKNKDAKRLHEMGSVFTVENGNPICPTCSQIIPETLLPDPLPSPIMSIDENIDFISNNLDTFVGMQTKIGSALARKNQRLQGLVSTINSARESIRTLSESLTLDGRLPSKEAMRELILLEERCKKIARVSEAFEKRLNVFLRLSEKYHSLIEDARSIPQYGISDEDREKLLLLTSSLISQLKEYGFISFSPDLITISNDSYRPIRDGVEVGITLSASDMIRVIWAYTLGMFEVALRTKCTHPGLVVLDEPRQQSAKDVSFRTLLQGASKMAEKEGQIIVFTSEPLPSLNEYLSGTKHNLIHYVGRIVQPILNS